MTDQKNAKPTLRYFAAYGAAEVSRMMMGVSGVDFEDVTYGTDKYGKFDEKEKAKQPFGQVPTLQLPNGTILAQSQAIERYVARTNKLYGKSAECAFRIDMIVEALLDIVKQLVPIVMDFKKQPPGPRDEKEKQGLLDEWMAKKWPTWADQLTAQLKKNKDGASYWVGDALTYADYSFWQKMFMLNAHTDGKALKDHKLLSDLYDRISKDEKLAAYVKSRPKYPH